MQSPVTSIKMMRYVIPAVCLFATACGGGIAASPTSPTRLLGGLAQTEAQGGDQLPFKGSLQGLEADVVAPPYLLVNGTATGTGVLVGRFNAAFTATVTLATGSGIGTISFTAANGDRLDASFAGQGTPAAEPGFASIEEVATINGGTGRFAGATGEFTIRRLLDQTTGVSSGSFEGTLNLHQ